MADQQEDTRHYLVLVNAEEQYSLWLQGREIPPGWRAVDKDGTRSECLQYVEKVWTDMRPLSLRRSAARAKRPRRMKN